jgi:hypothetical protein
VGDFIFCGSSYDEVGIAEFDWEGADWIELAHYSDKWRAFVNAVMNIQGP